MLEHPIGHIQSKNPEEQLYLLQRTSASLRLLSSINQLIVREHDFRILLEQSCQLIVQNGYAYSWVSLFHPGSISPEFFAHAGAALPFDENVMQRRPLACARQAVRSRSCVFISPTPSGVPCSDCQLLSPRPQLAAFTIPIQRPQRVFGALSVARQFAAESFDELEKNLFRELTDDLAYALENIEIENQRRAIAETASRLVTIRGEAEFWPATLQTVRAVLHADRAAIYVYDETADRLTCPYSTGLSQDYIDEVNRRFHEVPGSRLLQSPQPVSINDTQIDPQAAAMRAWFQREGIRSYAVFSLLAADKPQGAFVAYRSSLFPFTPSDLEAGQTLAHLVSASLRNVRLFTELQRSEEKFRKVIKRSADGIVLVDEQGAVIEWNTGQEAITGLLRSETLGKPLWEIQARLSPSERQTPDLAAFIKPMMEAFLKNGEAPWLNRLRDEVIQRLDGARRITQTVVFSIPTEKGFMAGSVTRDITEQKQAEAKIREQAEALMRAYDSTLEGWARALELRDKDTEGHTRRVTELALQLARAMNFSEEQLIHLRRGAILHDIGKVAVPDAILHKTGDLTPAEQEIIRRHPGHAYEMLSVIPFLIPALDIPYCHHEKWDGTGYPRGLKGEHIPLSARLFSVADVYDALTSDRPYRCAWKPEDAVDYIVEQSGRQFDPQVVQVFLALEDKG